MSAAQQLNELIRDVAESMPDDATARDIAEAVVEKAGQELIAASVLDLICERVTDVLRTTRNTALTNTGGRSSKLQRRRDWWGRMLQSRVHVGDGVWKPLGACTVDDLRACVAERKEQIKQTQMQINNYHHLIERMEKHKASTVSDLNPEQVDL